MISPPLKDYQAAGVEAIDSYGPVVRRWQLHRLALASRDVCLSSKVSEAGGRVNPRQYPGECFQTADGRAYKCWDIVTV